MDLGEYQAKRHLQQVAIRKKNRIRIYEAKRYQMTTIDQNPLSHGSHAHPSQPEDNVTPQASDYTQCCSSYQQNQIIHTANIINSAPELYAFGESSTTEEPQSGFAVGLHLYSLKERSLELYGPQRYPPPFSPPPIKSRQNRGDIPIDPNYSQIILEYSLPQLSTIDQNHYPSHLSEAILDLQNQEDMQALHRGIMVVKKLTESQWYSTICQRVVQSGLIPILIKMLKQQTYNNLRLYAGRVLINLAASNQSACGLIVEQGGLEASIDMLKSGQNHLMEVAIILISHLSDRKTHANQILAAEALTLITNLAEETSQQPVLLDCLWAMASIIHSAEKDTASQEIKRVCVFLCRVLSSDLLEGEQNDEYLFATVMALQKMFNLYWQDMARTAVLPYFIHLLNRSIHEEIAYQVAKLLSAFAEIDVSVAEIMIEEEVLEVVHKLLMMECGDLVEEGLYLLGCIAMGCNEHVEKVMARRDILDQCRKIMESDNPSLSKQACNVFTSIAIRGKHQQVFSCYKEQNILQPLSAIIRSSSNNDLLQASLELLLFLLQCGSKECNRASEKERGRNVFGDEVACRLGIIDSLLLLQDHQSSEICDRASNIINDHFKDFLDESPLDI